MFGRLRARTQQRQAVADSVRLARLADAVDQALTVVDGAIRANPTNAELVDACLDIRLVLAEGHR